MYYYHKTTRTSTRLFTNTLIKVHYNTNLSVHSICQNRFVFIKISFCPSFFYFKTKINEKNNIKVLLGIYIRCCFRIDIIYN